MYTPPRLNIGYTANIPYTKIDMDFTFLNAMGDMGQILKNYFLGSYHNLIMDGAAAEECIPYDINKWAVHLRGNVFTVTYNKHTVYSTARGIDEIAAGLVQYLNTDTLRHDRNVLTVATKVYDYYREINPMIGRYREQIYIAVGTHKIKLHDGLTARADCSDAGPVFNLDTGLDYLADYLPPNQPLRKSMNQYLVAINSALGDLWNTPPLVTCRTFDFPHQREVAITFIHPMGHGQTLSFYTPKGFDETRLIVPEYLACVIKNLGAQ